MDRLASYIDMTEQQHRTALEVTFEECAEYGYQSLLEALKKGYESIGYSRGRNTLVNLCKFLLENHAITKTVVPTPIIVLSISKQYGLVCGYI